MSVFTIFKMFKKKINNKQTKKSEKTPWIEKVERLERQIRSELKPSEMFLAPGIIYDKDRNFTDFYADHINEKFQLQIELVKTNDIDGYAEIKICKHIKEDYGFYHTDVIKNTKLNVNKINDILQTIRTFKKEIELKELFKNQ